MRRLTRTARLAGVACCVLAFAAAHPSGAQSSAFVPVDDNAYAYLDALLARNHLWQLSALERPYRVIDITRAMAADTTEASPRVQRLLRQLGDALAKYGAPTPSAPADSTGGVRILFTPYLFATGQTSGIRDLMRADSTSHLRPGFGGVGIMQAGAFVIGARALEDTRLKDDPEYLGQKNRWYVGRMQDAYISAQFKYAELFAGRLGRNWGPSRLDGLTIGNYVYTYDQAYVKLGVPKLNLSGLFTRLDDDVHSDGSTVDTARRYLGAHRLATRFGGFEASVSEAVVYGGVGEGLRPAYANPVVPFILSEVSDNNHGNILYGLDMSLRSRLGQFAGQFLLDDVSKDDCGVNCDKPNSYGYTFQAEGLPLWGDQRLYASYTRVANLTYRSVNWAESYTYQDVSLGRGYSDYDEARGGVDLLLPFGIPIRAYVALRRQGEGDYRQPHPTPDQYAVTSQFLQGTVQRTTRFAISGTAAAWRYIQLSGDVGFNRVTNSEHVVGATKDSFVGRVQLTLESPWRLATVLHAD